MTTTDTTTSATRPSDWLATIRQARSIAVIGASNDERRPGGRAVAALRRFGFVGTIYPVNPGRDEIQGLPCYPSIAAIGESVDIAFVLVGAEQAVVTLGECSRLGVPLVIIGTAGFRESGSSGVLLEEKLTDLLVPGTRVLGPNTNGLAWLGGGAVACFSPALQQPGLELRDGPVAIVAQSGALGAATFTLAQTAGLDIGLMVNTGNEVDLRFEEVLQRLCVQGAGFDVVLSYVEGISDPEGLVRAARVAAAQGVTLVMLKVGRTEAGAAAAAAHTAKLAGSDRTFDGVLKQLGVIRADTLTDLVGLGIAARSSRPLGHRVTVASLSGGLGIIVADAVSVSSGLTLATWSADMQSRFDELLPDYLSRANPLDLGGGPFWDLPILQQILTVIDEAPDSDMTVLAVANFEGAQDEITDAILEVAGRLGTCLYVVWYGGAERSRQRLNKAGIPAFAEPTDAVRTMAALARRARSARVLTSDVEIDTERQRAARALIAGGSSDVLDQDLVASVLRMYDVPIIAHQMCPVDGNPPEPTTLPCYVKLSSPQLTHKSDAGGVVVAHTAEQARAAVDGLRELAAQLQLTDAEIILQQQVSSGSELLLGMTRDPIFGPVLTVGLGGVLAEAFDDVSVRLPLVDAEDVAGMLTELRHEAIVRGFRGMPALDAPPVVDAVLKFSQLVQEIGELLEAVDVNPLIVSGDGVVTAVDMLMVRRA